jgi:hypothetical protein
MAKPQHSKLPLLAEHIRQQLLYFIVVIQQRPRDNVGQLAPVEP